MSAIPAKQRRKPQSSAKRAVSLSEVVEVASVQQPQPSRFSPAVVSRLIPKIEINDRVWLIASAVIIIVAAGVRLYALELKPMHHDEGVNGFFLTSLVRQGIYRYDPTNYHGPTLYYLAKPLVSFFGLNVFSVRLLTTLAGIGVIVLVLDFRRYIGSLAALSAGALIAVSPGATFYSRYFIHEMLFVLFTLGIVNAALRFYESRRVIYLALAALSAALLTATKETAFVSVITLGLAWLVTWFWTNTNLTLDCFLHSIFRFPISARRHQQNRELARETRLGSIGLRSVVDRIGGRDRVVMLFLYAVGVFLFVNVLFYSSLFTNWPGVKGAIQALKVWTNTGTSEFHGKPFGMYVNWLLQEEMPIFILAIAGAFTALFDKRLNRFAIFVGAWAFGLFVAYSLIPYKTPWLMLSFIVPMAVVAGYAIQQWSDRSFGNLRAPIPALCLITSALLILGYQSFVLNYREYDNDKYPYVYAHTSRELTALVNEVDRIAQRAGTKELGVSIASPENWPLPWYFRDYTRVGYVGTVAERYDSKETPIVIGREGESPEQDQTVKLQSSLGPDYEKLGTFTLRPGVRLALFARRDLAVR